MFSRSISDGAKRAGSTSRLSSCELRLTPLTVGGQPGLAHTPVRNTSTRSVRGVAGAGIP